MFYFIFNCCLYPITWKVLEICLNIGIALEKLCFEMFTRTQVVNMKIVEKALRNL